MRKIYSIITIIVVIMILLTLSSCDISGSRADIAKTQEVGNTIQTNQPTPTDIDYSLERYNLIRRAYWVNGQREKAMSLPCEVEDLLDILLYLVVMLQ